MSETIPSGGDSFTSDLDKKEILLQMGIGEEFITEFEDYFLIGGDCIMEKVGITEDLINPLAPISLNRQMRSDGFVDNDIVTDIRVWIDPSFDINWQILIGQAINIWNDAGSMVDFDIVLNNPHIRIFNDANLNCPIAFRNLGNGTCGLANTPVGGNPGSTVSINVDASSHSNNVLRLSTVIHELGHTVGLLHTNEGEGTQIPFTPETDNNSIMNGGECGIQQGVLSNFDLRAIQVMYNEATWTRSGVSFDHGGWHIGDFNGDGRDDVFRYLSGVSGADMFLSNGNRFVYDGSWTGAGTNFDQGGWHIGDFNGDGRDDIFRYRQGVSGAEVYLSDGSSFVKDGSWTGAGVNFNHGGWHIGDFNGDGRDDIFRYRQGISGAEVFLSNGSSFILSGSWTAAGVNFNHGGWHIGDFNGDGRDDIFRYRQGISGAEVFLSNGSSFTLSGSWTGAGVDFNQGGWHIGDFNGDGRDDIFRYQKKVSGAQVFRSTGSSFTNAGSWTGAGVDFDRGGWHIGDFTGEGRTDIFRYVATIAGADMFESNGTSFVH